MSQAVVRRHLSLCALHFHYAEKATRRAICREITWVDPPEHKASNTALALQRSVQSCSVHQSQRRHLLLLLGKRKSIGAVFATEKQPMSAMKAPSASLCHLPHRFGTQAITERFQVIVFGKEAPLGKWRDFLRLYTKLLVDLGTLGLLSPFGI